MRFMPKRIKHRKHHRGKIRGKANRGNTVAFGQYGLQTLESGRIKADEIEACRMAINKVIGEDGNLWIRIFPDKPYTTTAAETRMGKGKGEPDYYAADVKEGGMLFEIAGVDKEVAREAFNRAAHKMPVRCKFAERKPLG
jgi:large subunit ribosomal protein L16